MPEFFVLRTAKTWRPAGCIRPIFLSCWTRLILTALPVRVGLREVKRIVYLVSLMLFRILSIQEESSVYRFWPGDAGFFPTSFYGSRQEARGICHGGLRAKHGNRRALGKTWVVQTYGLKTKPVSGGKGD